MPQSSNDHADRPGSDPGLEIPSREAALRLASYNVRAGLGTDWRRDAGRVIDTIAGLNADVVALQEADFRMGQRPTALPRDLITARTGLVALPIGANGTSLGWHGNAILARPGLHLMDVERLILPGLEPRGAVIADLDGTFRLRLVAVHLGLLRRSRKAQFDAINAALGRRTPWPTVILGDFNERSRNTGLGRIARPYQLLTPQASYPARYPIYPLDRMAHSNDLFLHLLDIPYGPAPHPSDHLPILAEVTRA